MYIYIVCCITKSENGIGRQNEAKCVNMYHMLCKKKITPVFPISFNYSFLTTFNPCSFLLWYSQIWHKLCFCVTKTFHVGKAFGFMGRITGSIYKAYSERKWVYMILIWKLSHQTGSNIKGLRSDINKTKGRREKSLSRIWVHDIGCLQILEKSHCSFESCSQLAK